MDNLLFLNHGSTDTRVKLVSLDGNPIVTNSAGAIFGEGNELGFCLRADTELLEMLKPDDSGVIRLQGSFTFEFKGEDIYGNYNGTRPTHIVDASNFGKLIEAEYSDYLQVEIPPDAPQPDPENGVPFSYILKTKYRKCWLRIYSLSVDSSLSADAIGNGSAAWMDEDVQNGAIFHFGDSVTPSPTPLTYTANGNTSLVVSPYPGESVKVMVDWGYGWFNTYDVTTPLTQIDWTASTSLKNVRIFFDRPIEGLGISNVVALTEWGSAEISRVRFNHFWHNTSYTGRLVPDHIPTYLTDLSGMFQDTFSEDSFNEDISMWDVSHVTDMSYMFRGAQHFNQDLSGWCVTKITSLPTDFATNSGLTEDKYPVWGTCPFRGVSLLKFTSTRDDVRVKLTSSAGVEQRTYIVNTATGQQASSIVGSTVINVGAGDWTLYCKEDTLTVPVSDLVLQVTGDGLTHVHEWSKQPIGEMSLYNQSQSYGTSPNLIKVPAVRPNSTQTSFNSFLNGASRFNDPSISEWDMSGVTNLVGFFGYCTVFDQSLANWDTSEVLYMADMFRGAKAFNQPLDTWDVSKVRNMSGLFRETNLFNQPLDSWNTGSATNMEYMFAETMSFNQPLDNWDVSNVTTMRRMFWFASAFDQPLPSWKVGNVTDMEDMFSGAPDYDYDLSMWCVTNITSRPPGFRDRQGALILDPVWGTCPNSTKPPTDPTGMTTPYTFKTASTAFNASSSDPFAVTVQGVRHDAVLVDTTYTLTDIASAVGDIITVEPADYAVGYTSVIKLTAQPSEIINWSDFHWDDKVVGVQPSLLALLKVPTTAPLTRNFEGLLMNAVLYLGADVTNWDTSEVTNFKRLFQGCIKFVGEIGGWDTSKVTSFANLFTYCHEFNGDITGWDTSSVTTLEMMLLDTRKFNQPIGSWNVSKVTNMNNMIYNGWAMAADLSQWCVSLIPTEPTGFILSANQLAGKPVWGTCPNGS